MRCQPDFRKLLRQQSEDINVSENTEEPSQDNHQKAENLIAVFDVAIVVNTFARIIEISFLSQPVPGTGLSGVIWEVVNQIPCIQVVPFQLDHRKVEFCVDWVNDPPLNAIAYELTVPYNVDLDDLTRYFFAAYSKMGLAVTVVRSEFGHPVKVQRPNDLFGASI